MTKKEKILAAKLLMNHSNNLVENICNDLQDHFLEDWTEEEKNQLLEEMYEYFEFDEDAEDRYFTDFALAEYLAHKLNNEK